MFATERKDRQHLSYISNVDNLGVGVLARSLAFNFEGQASTDDTGGRYSRYGAPPKIKPPEERPPPPKPKDGNDKPLPPPKGPRVPSIPGVD